MPLCSKTFLDWQDPTSLNMVFECNGQTQISGILSAGIMSYSATNDYARLTNMVAKCFYDPDGSDADLFTLMPYFDRAAFDSELLAVCLG